VLAGALGGIYVAGGVTLLGQLPRLALTLILVGLLQTACAAGAHRGGRFALGVTVLLNALLVACWLLSRTAGLSLGGGPRQPVGVLDALCAADSILILGLALCARAPGEPRRWWGALCQASILLAVLSVSALLGGHTHTARAAALHALRGGAPQTHLYCRLL